MENKIEELCGAYTIVTGCSNEEYEIFTNTFTMKMLEIFLKEYTLKKEDIFYPNRSFRNFLQLTYAKLLNKESYEELSGFDKLNFEHYLNDFKPIQSFLLSSQYSSNNLLKLIKE